MDTRSIKTVMFLGMTPLDTGITKDGLFRLMQELPTGTDYVPIQFFENNTAAYGFIEREFFEKFDYDPEPLKGFVCPILDDMRLEKPDETYPFAEEMQYRMFNL